MLVVYAVVVDNLNIFDVGQRFLCVVRVLRLMTYPSNTLLDIGGIIYVIFDYLVDDIFICVFH